MSEVTTKVEGQGWWSKGVVQPLWNIISCNVWTKRPRQIDLKHRELHSEKGKAASW